jgi:hypothetical protein
MKIRSIKLAPIIGVGYWKDIYEVFTLKELDR